jgi:hypothetical protein
MGVLWGGRMSLTKLKNYGLFYRQLCALVGGELKTFMEENEYKKIENEPYMTLHIDVLSHNRLSMAHNYTQNGDVMADPDMEVFIDHENRLAFPLTYQQDGLGIYQEAYQFDEVGHITGFNRKLAASFDSFFKTWLRNLKNQGFYKTQKVTA